MKTIYKILLFTIILQTSAFSQFEVLTIIKPTTSVEPCDGKINLEFVESELPYQLDFASSAGQSGSFTVTSTVFSLPDLCPGNIAILVVDNHGCSTEKDVVLEECGEIDISFEVVYDGYITIEAIGLGAPFNLKLYDSKGRELYVTDESEFTEGDFKYPIGLYYDKYKIVVTNNQGCEFILYQVFNEGNCELKVRIANIDYKDCNNKIKAIIQYELLGFNNNLNQNDITLWEKLYYKHSPNGLNKLWSLWQGDPRIFRIN